MQNSRWWNSVIGCVSGLALVAGVWQFWTNAGTSLPAQTALLLTLLAAVGLNGWLPNPWRTARLARPMRLFVLSAWTVAVPSFCDLSWRLLEATGEDWSTSILWQVAALTVLALATIFVPTACVLGIGSPQRSVAFGVSFALAGGVGGVVLAADIGPDGCGLLASACSLIALVVGVLVRTPNSLGASEQPASSPPFNSGFMLNVALAAIGLVWMVAQRMCRQLIPDSFALMTMEWSVLIAGIAVGGWWSRGDRRPTLATVGLALSCWIWLCLAAFPLGVRLTLWENATISQVWLLQSLRLMLAGVVLGPIAVCCGAILGQTRSALSVTSLAGSAILTLWWLPAVGVWNLAGIAASLLLVTVAAGWWQSGNRVGQAASREASGFTRSIGRFLSANIAGANARRFARVRVAAVSALLLFTLSAPVWVRYRPELAAKVLFDTSVFVASRTGMPWGQLSVLDEGRAVAVVEGDRGTLTAWKFAGSRLLVRENGIPKGTLATNVELAPRFVPDVLPTVLPLVTHERPQSLLLLGLRAGEPVELATMFPLRRIVCVEADRGVVELCRRLPLTPGPSPQRGEGRETQRVQTSLDDDRLETRLCDPALAVRTIHEQFDVIVASADQPSLPQAVAGFTVECLREAAGCLNDDGIFAIRFQHIDLGPRSVRGLAKTLSAAFREVAAVEIAPGELLFLGTNGERGFAREAFIERWQRPQVRQLLASVGWDWSTPLRLPMLNQEALRELVQTGATVNEASSSTWPFRMPLEVMRWENKLQQVQAELTPHERFLMAWGGDEANNADVAARLSEWELSRAIIRRHADEYWAYRKQVKDHMTGSPRAMIQQASHSAGEDSLHPDDRRRLNYFRTIGDLAKNPAPTPADLDRLRRFESPFDPLVSPFLHQEVVELTSRCAVLDVADELHHRLAAVYFSTPADRSIRNVADALQFVNSTPTAIPDQAKRYDHLNALLQMLLARWTARGEFRPTSSRVALNDIERSLAAVEATFATLDTLAAAGVLPASEWRARQQYLERRLVRPLRTYRGQVLQHYVKNERTKTAAESFPPDAESDDDR